MYENNFFLFEYYTTPEGETNYYLDCYDGDTGVITHEQIDVSKFVQEGLQEWKVHNFSVVNEEEYVFFCEAYDEGELCAETAFHVDREGNILSETELLPGIKDSGIDLYDKYSYTVLDVDGEGYYYITELGFTRILVLDAQGQEVCIMDPEIQDNSVSQVMKTPDGVPVFEHADGVENKTTLFMFDSGSGQMKKLAVLDRYLLVNSRMLTDDGICYFMLNSKLYRWDVYTGKWSLLMNCGEQEVGINDFRTRVAFNPEGEMLMFDYSRSPCVYVLSTEEPSTEGYARLVSLTADCNNISSAAAEFTRQHMDLGITVEYPQEDAAAYRDRIMTEIASGKMPDILYVSGEDMEILYDKGLLADLTGILPDEIAEQIFPGVLECGSIEGQQIGYPIEAVLSTMLVHKSIWKEADWSLEELLELVKERQDQGLEAIIATARAPYSSSGALRNLALQDLEHSPFLDLETGTCSFDSQEFVELLELCRQYGKVVTSREDAAAMVRENRALAYVGDMETISGFSLNMQELGEDYYCVGFPTEGESGSYWNCDYYMVVGKDTLHMDKITEFLKYLYSLERQRKQDSPIRRDVYTTGVTEGQYREEWGTYASLDKGDQSAVILPCKADGTSWVREYLELAEHCVPGSRSSEAIAEIVLEEADSFFNGDKDAVTVASVIQSRVQLYLAERQ